MGLEGEQISLLVSKNLQVGHVAYLPGTFFIMFPCFPCFPYVNFRPLNALAIIGYSRLSAFNIAVAVVGRMSENRRTFALR